MTPRPLIFISAVSKELRSARQLVANTLTFLGYQPVWQDIFGTESGDLRSVLREKIDQCKGVVQLVGQCYGAEPPVADEEFGRVSYTQYEALYARERGKKVWYLFIDETFHTDPCDSETDELRELQVTYRRRVQADTHLFHPLTSPEALEAGVLKLRDDLVRLRRGVKRWAVGVTALLLFVAVAILWLVQAQRRQSGAIQKESEQVNTIVDRYQKMQQALVRLADVEAQSKQPGEKLTPEEERARAYAVLEKELGLGPGTLAKEIPGFALELYNRSDTRPLERARAAYALSKFDEAEKLSLEGAEQDKKAYETAKRVVEERRKSALDAYELAARSADQRVQYADALAHLRKAEQLTDRARDALEWARVQFGIAQVLYDQGQYSEVERILRQALQEREQLLGPEHPETVDTRHYIARAIVWQGRYAEGEAECRRVIQLREKLLGPEHPATLKTRNELANALDDEGKYAEAEAEHRAVLKLREKVLGPEDIETLHTRHNLALVLQEQGKYADAEAEYRAVARLKEKVLGPEHPDTLTTHMNLVSLLDDEGKFVEAESEHRMILGIQQKTVGPEHPYTLMTRSNLGDVLDHQGKYGEAEAEDRAVLKLEEKVLGPEHPYTLKARQFLAEAIDHKGAHAQAEAEYRALLKLSEKVLGPDHPDTLLARAGLAICLSKQQRHEEAEAMFSEILPKFEKAYGVEHLNTLDLCYNYAQCLQARGKVAEARELVKRATVGAQKRLGSNHPSTTKYEKLLADLEARP